MPVLSQKALHSSSQEGCGLQNKPRLQCSYTAVPSCSWPAATSASSLVIDGNRCCRNGLQRVWDHTHPLLLAHGRGDQTVLMLSATLAEALVPPGAVVFHLAVFSYSAQLCFLLSGHGITVVLHCLAWIFLSPGFFSVGLCPVMVLTAHTFVRIPLHVPLPAFYSPHFLNMRW